MPIKRMLNQLLKTPKDIRHIQVMGQRCSGTNYLQSLAKNNFGGIEEYQIYGWKHGFLRKVFRENSSTAMLVIFRNPFDWVRSLHKQPHHTHPDLRNLSFSDFIRHEWHCVWDEDGGVKKGDPKYMTEMMMERNPKTQERFANALKLRSAKIAHYLGYRNRVEHLYYTNYEELRENYPEIITDISNEFDIPLKHPEIKNVDTYKGYKKKKFSGNKYEAISDEDLQFIKENLDWELEEQIGYSFNDYNG